MKKPVALMAAVFYFSSPALACTPPDAPHPTPENVQKIFQLQSDEKPLTQEQERYLQGYKDDQGRYFALWLNLHPCPMYESEMENFAGLSEEKKRKWQ